MNLLTVDHVTKVFTQRKIFEDASFYLQEQEKVGVIGINGTGKSTLLKMIAGMEEPDSGEVIYANQIVVHYLPQMPEFDPDATVLESVLSYVSVGSVHKESNKDEHEMWNLESSAKSMMTKLGIYDFDEKTGHLSGGQKKRLALVAVLLTPCDVLLLDEPTNHLDAEMAEWLENYLKNYRGAMIMVTHDRYFLDSVCNLIVEVDHGKIYSYETNYSGYLEARAQRIESMEVSERKRQSFLKKEIEWIRRGAKARTTKQKARIERYETLRDQKAMQADKQVEMSSISSRMGRTTVELSHIHKEYEDRVLIDDFSYIFLKQDRIGFVGSNGCGKTTLMKIIDQRIEPDSGEVIIGQTIKIGYYTQEIEQDPSAGIAYMDPKLRVIDYIKNTAEFVRTQDGLISASAMLDKFLFPPEEQYGLIEKLSGGEKRRLNLLRVLMEAPNVLILDEPTNDLDITTLAILEDYLDNYEGIVITVSHDRYFLDRVVRRIFAFEEGGQLRQYEGGYTDYRNKAIAEGRLTGSADNTQTKQEVREASGEKTDAKSTWTHEKKLKFTYKEQKEYETIEDDIAAMEERMEAIDEEMVKNAHDFVKLNELTKEKSALETSIEEKMERWAYLEELAAKIAAQ
ncbi:MAG: ABC-F family ATP-binding cassette domain-containing protein [Lachnobacterium sp.]|nr:ABC-F family ATP-binding cassette domain-containing protein [Lachnobacterium sp.]